MMAPIHSTDSLALECSGCMETYLVARRATYEELELVETWMETHGRCPTRPGFAGAHMARPRATRWEEPFRREVEAALARTAAQLPLLAAMLDRKGIAGADIVREQYAAMVALLATLRARRLPSYPEGPEETAHADS
jgi:hypothetical protein